LEKRRKKNTKKRRFKIIDGGQSLKSIAMGITNLIRETADSPRLQDEFDAFCNERMSESDWQSYDPPDRIEILEYYTSCADKVFQYLQMGVSLADDNCPLLTSQIAYDIDGLNSPVQIRIMHGVTKEDAIAVLKEMVDWLEKDWESLINPDPNAGDN